MRTTNASRLSRVAILGALVAGLALDFDPAQWVGETPFSTAEARVGRPLTPVSVAGVARRTTRRVVRRTTVYVAALPAGCRPVVINGANFYSCGAVYYQPHGNQYVLVEVQ
ncbi:hypothetical protein [Rubrimonas sp.]|uniref:hypothetical protein n=1 Tax=Rubrimonas sp. TaxID=2036015 RepID=UPI002FDE4B67